MTLRARHALVVLASLCGPANLVTAQPDASQPERATPAPSTAARAEPAAPPQITPPRLVSPAALEWPETAQPPADPVEVILTIDPSGSVSVVELPVSFGAEADPVIEAAAQQLRFEPARRAGEPIAARIRLRFQLAAPEPATPGAVPPSAAPGAPQPDAGAAAPALSPPGAAPAPAAAAELVSEPESYGARAQLDRPPPGAASRVKLTGRELTMIPGTFGEPLRVVATLPGVARSPFSLGFFLVRGASFQNTGFMVDGFAVPLLYHVGAGPAILSSRLVEQLDFYPGGYPVRYGQYSAGIIALRTAPPATERLQLELEVDLLRASALVIVPFPDRRGSIAIAFRRSYYELLLPLITDDVSLAYTDYQLRLDYRLSDDLRVSALFFGSRDRLRASQSLGAGGTTGGASQGFDYAFDQLILSADWQPAPTWRLRWAGTLGPTEINLGGERTGDGDVGTRSGAFRLGERLEWIATPSRALQTTLGAEVSVYIYDVTGSIPSLGEFPAIPAPGSTGETLSFSDRLSELVFAPYLEQVVRPGPFEITAGLRSNYYRYGDLAEWILDPRGVVRYALSQRVSLKAATGLFTQPPVPFQLTRGTANPRLLPDRSWQSSVGAELDLPASFEIDSTLFYSHMWQIARATGALVPDPSGETAVRPFFASDGEGRAYGFELLVRRQVEQGLFGWLSYTLSRSERFLDEGRHVVFAFDQTHVMHLALSYAVNGWTFGARFSLASGRPVGELLDPSGERTPFDADADDFDPNSQGRRVRLPTYHELDVRIDREWRLGPVKGSVFIDVLNVYNAQNSEGYQYSYDFSQRGRLPGLPILPTLGVRGVLQ